LTVVALFVIRWYYPAIPVTIPRHEHQTAPVSTSKTSDILHPKSLNLPVPFTPQAPTANWDQLHDEACEEASAIMANAYFKGDGRANLPPEYVEKEIIKLTEWQQKNYGHYLDTTTAETAKMIEKVYGLKTRLAYDFTAEDLKDELTQGHLVIISEYGRDLGNPYYKQPGPVHHMLLLKGYDQTGNFITNDSGTKRGKNYAYDFHTIYNAAADWDLTAETVNQNIKIILIVWK